MRSADKRRGGLGLHPNAAAAIVIALLACPLCNCGQWRDPEGKIPVRIVTSSQVYGALPVVIAQTLGYYDEEGLEVRIESVQSNTKAVHALAGGSADVSTGNFGQVLGLAVEGRDVKAFRSHSARLPAGARGRSRLSEQNSQRSGSAPRWASVVSAAAHHFLNWVLARHGMSVSTVTPVSIGTLATAVAAVEHGKSDAAVLNEVEYLMLQKRGVAPVVLVDGRGPENSRRVYGVGEYPTAVLMATGPWLREHADTARRLVRAMERTLRWMRQQPPASVLRKMPARYRGDQDIDVAVVSTVLPMFSEHGRMTAEAAEAVKRVLSVSVESIRNSSFDLTRTYTNEFLTGQ